jgi:hypothetical protein
VEVDFEKAEISKAVRTALAKHLPGQHDQSSHGNWAGNGSGGDRRGPGRSSPGSDPGDRRVGSATIYTDYAGNAGRKLATVKAATVEEAAKLITEGYHVEFDQPRGLSTFLDGLSLIAKDAEAKGQHAPTYNLCNVSVRGSNLFCAQNKGIPRIRMPQLSGIPTPGSKADALPKNRFGEVDLTQQFRDHLKETGHAIHNERARASYLRASQSELEGRKVAGIMASYRHDRDKPDETKKLNNQRLFVSKDDYIVDGHHRWAAIVGVDLEDNVAGDLSLDVARVDMPITDLLDEANRFAIAQGIPQRGMADMADSTEKKPATKARILGRRQRPPACISC